MKIILTLLTLLLFSCKTAILQNNSPIIEVKKLRTLLKNKIDDDNFISFNDVGLKILKNNDSLEIFKDDVLVFKANQKFSKLYQIFEDDFLIISISKSNTTAGIEVFSRDSTYIVDLKNNLKGFIALKNIVLESDKKKLIDFYEFHEITVNIHCAIDSININKNELFLIQPDLSIKKYAISKAY